MVQQTEKEEKMKKQLKRIAVASMAVCLTASMAGCAPGGEEEGTPGAPHIGIIFTQAGLGGNSFNDLALEGVRKAAEDFGITYDQVEPKSVADEEIIQDEMASSEEYDLIICVGDEQVDALENVASVYTDQKFALLDATSDLPNVASYSCKAQEGSFMVGALAVLAKQEQIDSKLSDGDTIGAAGASGMGVFQAAEEKGFAAIGVNLNQNNIAPDYIMASMLKKLDTCAYEAIASVVNDTYTGENQLLGLSDGGVDYTVEGSNIKVPDDIISRLDEIREEIISGEIEVPNELD